MYNGCTLLVMASDKTVTRNLTAKEEQYVNTYMVGGNKTEAYEQTYSTHNLCRRSIRQRGYEVSRRPSVALEILRRRAEAREANKIDLEEFVSDCVDASRVALTSFYLRNKKGRLRPRPFEDLTRAEKLAIKRIMMTSDGELLGYELKDTQFWANLLAKHLGMIAPDSAQSLQAVSINIHMEAAPPAVMPIVVHESDD